MVRNKLHNKRRKVHPRPKKTPGTSTKLRLDTKRRSKVHGAHKLNNGRARRGRVPPLKLQPAGTASKQRAADSLQRATNGIAKMSLTTGPGADKRNGRELNQIRPGSIEWRTKQEQKAISLFNPSESEMDSLEKYVNLCVLTTISSLAFLHNLTFNRAIKGEANMQKWRVDLDRNCGHYFKGNHQCTCPDKNCRKGGANGLRCKHIFVKLMAAYMTA